MASLPYPRSHTIGGYDILAIPTQPINIKTGIALMPYRFFFYSSTSVRHMSSCSFIAFLSSF